MTERLPWVRLSSILKSHVANNELIEEAFAEHLRRVRGIAPDEWEEACRKELKRKADLFDSHPSLRDRLKAMGVSPKRAAKLLPDQDGPPARDLFPQWGLIERLLTDYLVGLYRRSTWSSARRPRSSWAGRSAERGSGQFPQLDLVPGLLVLDRGRFVLPFALVFVLGAGAGVARADTAEAVSSVLPSGRKATPLTLPQKSLRVATGRPAATSHTWTLPPALPNPLPQARRAEGREGARPGALTPHVAPF